MASPLRTVDIKRQWRKASRHGKLHARATEEACYEDRTHRPSQPDRRRYRPQYRILPARAGHEDREHGRRPGGTLFRSAEDPSRRRWRGYGDDRRKTDAGTYLLYHRG